MRPSPSWLWMVGVALAAACGGGGGGSSSSGNNPANQVAISDYVFMPNVLMVKAGTTVTWTNTGPSSHDTTSDTMVWDSGSLAPPSDSGDPYGGGSMGPRSFSRVFDTPGTYAYHCAIHPPPLYSGFTGTIVVTQ